MTGLLRCLCLCLLAALGIFCLPVQAAVCCPFCGAVDSQTLSNEVNQASMVLYGTLTNPRQAGNGEFGEGTTDLIIEAVIKKHDILKSAVTKQGDKEVITLSRYVPPDRENRYKFVVFCDVFKGRIDPFRGVAVLKDCDAAKYLQGALALKDKDVPTRLRFFFDYLDSADIELSNDAYKEFAIAGYDDVHAMAKGLPADKIAKWLQDPKTPAFRYGLYASLLGHAGKPEHAAVLRAMLDDPEKRTVSGIDGILAGYTLLKPQEGWEYTLSILKDSSREFTARYAALRTLRFFWDSRSDVIAKKQLLEGISHLLDQADIADLAIEDLRKWKQWDLADRVLGLRMKKSHDIPIIRRAILRYALNCPKPQAVQYVQAMRQQDPQMVRDAEELLKLEATPPAGNGGGK
jgi:hypothetical protein